MTTPAAMTPRDGVAWVTGASSGIGRGVALELARRGWTVAATARRPAELEALAREAEGLPGRIAPFVGDVTSEEAMRALADGIEAAHGPIALGFLNAGIAPYIQAPDLDLKAVRDVIEVNFYGVFTGLAALMPRMAARRKGQIAVTASVAGYSGLPRAAAYGATKAAVMYACEALKFDCDKVGILLQVVNPGFVSTPLTAKNDFPMPTVITDVEASRRTVDGFERGRFEITYPRRLAYTLKLLRILPYWLYFRIVGRATGWNR
jgi:NAD(P)-dependent dehydrogenase (short-subunit alcohol dehydrogenase family)